MRRVRNFGISAQKQGGDHHHYDYEHNAEHDWKPIGVAVFRRRGWRGLEQASHEPIVLLRIGEDFGLQIADSRSSRGFQSAIENLLAIVTIRHRRSGRRRGWLGKPWSREIQDHW